jgi:hypothetical protein
VSLVVSVYRREAVNNYVKVSLEPTARGNPDLAGPEVLRKTVWGGPVAQRLGCTVLPLLASQDIHAEEDLITALIDDLDRLRPHVDEIAASANAPPDMVIVRLENIARAAAIARAIPNRQGHVRVW